MSGRPSDPSYTVFPWALTSAYPAGVNPWSLQPTKQAPPTDIFTPEGPLAAEYANYILNALSANDSAAKATMFFMNQAYGQESALNVNAPCTPVGSPGRIFGALYNPLTRQHVATTLTTGPHFAATVSVDGGVSWSTPSLFVGAIAAGGLLAPMYDSAGNYYFLESGTLLPAKVWKVTGIGASGEAWTSTTSGLIAVTDECDAVTDGTNWFFSALDGTTDATLTICHGTVSAPATFTVIAAKTGAARAAMATNGTRFVYAARDLTASAVAAVISYTDNLGSTFTSPTLPVGCYDPSADTIKTLAYSASDGLFVISVKPAGSTSKIWTSPDAVTWTSAGTAPAVFTGLAMNGSLWMATDTAGAAWYSIDKGATWHAVELKMALGTGSPACRPQVVGTGNRFLLFAGAEVRTSLATGTMP